MPKYYRFRATTPTRRHRRCADEKQKDEEFEKAKAAEREAGWSDLTVAGPTVPSWYLRRTSWRESPTLFGLTRQMAAGLRASLITNKPIIMIKIPKGAQPSDFFKNQHVKLFF